MILKQDSPQAKSPYRIKPFQWPDWNTLWQLRAYQLAEDGIVIDRIPDRPDLSSPYEQDYHRIDQVYLRGRGNFWIAWEEGQPLGQVAAQDYGDFIELRNMYVRKEFRQRGIGTLLVQTLIEHCIEQNVGVIELWTAGDGLGHILYEKLGFYKVEVVGGEPEFAKRGNCEIRMRLVLNMIIHFVSDH